MPKGEQLDNALNAKGEQFHKSLLGAYRSQYGLQGKVFKHLARLIGNRGIVSNLNLLCCVITAFVFAVIVVLLAKKYNEILAACFFVTFWLSPWIINFARNLYWVEFTWFIPMQSEYSVHGRFQAEMQNRKLCHGIYCNYRKVPLWI